MPLAAENATVLRFQAETGGRLRTPRAGPVRIRASAPTQKSHPSGGFFTLELYDRRIRSRDPRKRGKTQRCCVFSGRLRRKGELRGAKRKQVCRFEPKESGHQLQRKGPPIKRSIIVRRFPYPGREVCPCLPLVWDYFIAYPTHTNTPRPALLAARPMPPLTIQNQCTMRCRNCQRQHSNAVYAAGRFPPPEQTTPPSKLC